MRKKRFLKLIDFIGALPPRKLDMPTIGNLNGSKRLDPHHCKSVACAMGWTPVIFPKLMKLEVNDYGVFHVALRSTYHLNWRAMAELFNIHALM